MFLHAESEDSDQTGWMPRLILVFAGRTGHFVGFVMRWFIFKCLVEMKRGRSCLKYRELTFIHLPYHSFFKFYIHHFALLL